MAGFQTDSTSAPPPSPSRTSTESVVAAPGGCRWTVERVYAHRESVWQLQRKLGLKRTPISATQKIRQCSYAGWVEGLWWRRLVAIKKVARWKILPETNDWATAVEIAQRVYPGTASWLLSCSASEGGHGPWVWYGGRTWSGYHVGNDYLGMDTVGGWMQFRFSTFDPYAPQAFRSVRARGFFLPDFGEGRYDAWRDPLAQALTAGYMRYFGRDGHHWAGSGC